MVTDGLIILDCREEEEQRKQMTIRKAKKYAMIGAASVGGGVLLGLTGGLVAPLIGASLGALIGINSRTLIPVRLIVLLSKITGSKLGVGGAGTVAGAAIVGSLFGAAGAGVTGYKMKKRVGDVEEFLFVPMSPGEGSRLHVTVAVPGWLPPPDNQNNEASSKEETMEEDDSSDYDSSDDDDDQVEAAQQQMRLMQSFDGLIHSRQQYGLKYETKYLAEMGRAMDAIYSMAISMAATEILKMTVLHGMKYDFSPLHFIDSTIWQLVKTDQV